MKKTKWLALGLSAVVACSACAGCKKGETLKPEDPSAWESLQHNSLVQIEFWGRDTAEEEVNYRNFINEFNNARTNISVTVQWQTDTQAYNTALDGRGSNLPDVFMLSNAMFIQYAASGKLADIRGHMDESLLDDIYESGYDVYYFDHDSKQPGRTDTAALYGLPKDQGPIAMTVNEDLLAKAVNKYNATAADADKIDLDRVMSTTDPMTFDEFIALGNKLKTQLGANQYVCAAYDMESAVYSNNAHYFTDDSATTAAIDSDNFVGAIEFIQNLYKNGILPSAGTSSSGAASMFTGGRAIFYYAGPWQTKEYWGLIDDPTNANRFTWDILPVLCGTAEGAVSTSYKGGMCYAISRNSKYKDAALELVKFLATDSSSQRTQYRRGQCIPNLISLAEEYSTDSRGLIQQQTGMDAPNPVNRSVWIDCVNGVGGSDKVTSKYRAASYTLDETWQSNLTRFMAGTIGNYGSFWEAKRDGTWVNVKEALSSYKPTVQAALDQNKRRLERY